MLNFGTLSAQTIAMQNERPGFIALLAYIGLVYAFLGDTFIFHESFNSIEVMGLTIILIMTLTLIASKMKFFSQK